jgi:hypothetical protein
VQYRRLILEPPVIAFKSGWRREHKEVSDKNVRRLRDMTSELFREEFERALIKNGTWQFAENPDADVLIVEPRIEDLDIPAPDPGTKTFTNSPVKLRVIGELRDAQTGVIVARVDMFDGNEDFDMGMAGGSRPREATLVTSLHKMRMSFGEWSQLLRGSLDVAKATRPHRSAPEAGGNLKPQEPAPKPYESSI